MAGSWAVLREELLRLQAVDPSPLRSWPNPASGDLGRRPFRLHLAAWAQADAERIHQLLGDEVRLRVGALSFPERLAPGTPMPPTGEAEDGRWSVSCTEQLRVASGHELRVRVTLNNRSQDLLQLRHPSRAPGLRGVVADPRSGRVVSGHVGASALMGGILAVAPGEGLDLVMTVCTDSVVAELGYAVPPGRWDARALFLDLDRTVGYSAPLPLTVF